MPRTLPAALTTVMDSGAYEPYIRVVVNDVPEDNINAGTVQPLGYTLRATDAQVTFAKYTDDLDNMQYFRIVRGALISGTPSTISTVWFIVRDKTYNGRFVTLKGHILDDSYRTTSPADTFQSVIETVFSDVVNAPTFEYEGTATWKSYQFYADAETPTFPRARNLINLLRQKYLVFVTEDGWNGTNNNFFFFCAPQARTTDYTFTDILFNGNQKTEGRRLIFRDQGGTVHSQGGATQAIHNLGFLKDTSAFPAANPANGFVGSRSSRLPVHLKYRTGDRATCAGDGSSLNNISNARINVIEVLDLKATPAWYMVIECLVWFGGSEGSIEPDLQVWQPPAARTNQAYNKSTAAPEEDTTQDSGQRFAQLATGRFTNILTQFDNNIQEAIETIDKHTHSTGSDGFELVTTQTPASEDGNIATWLGSSLARIQDSGVNVNDVVAGWKEIGTTWTYASADDPVYQIYVAGNITADVDYKLGNKLKCTVNSIVVYGFIVKVGSYDSGNNRTPIDVYMGTDYDLTNHTITNKFISKVKSPDGFPLSPAKWTVETNTSNSPAKSSPSAATWYGGTGLSPTGPSIDLPIGAWNVEYKITADYSSNLAAVANIGLRCTLSTANNSESDPDMTTSVTVTLPISTTALQRATYRAGKMIAVTSKTTYYANLLSGTVTGTGPTFTMNAGGVFRNIIRAVCAYL